MLKRKEKTSSHFGIERLTDLQRIVELEIPNIGLSSFFSISSNSNPTALIETIY